MKTSLPTFVRLFFFAIALFGIVTLVAPSRAHAASAYITPATGTINQPDPMLSVFVESTSSEPQIAGATIVVTYPAIMTVTTITNGEFDTYTESADDPATRQIRIVAAQNAGNSKAGRLRVASITFATTATSGDAQITIDKPNSSITGAGGEQLLTEVISGVYTIAVPAGTTTPPPETTAPDEITTVPDTGINQTLLYFMLGASLVALGLLAFANPLGIRRKQ